MDEVKEEIKIEEQVNLFPEFKIEISPKNIQELSDQLIVSQTNGTIDKQEDGLEAKIVLLSELRLKSNYSMPIIDETQGTFHFQSDCGTQEMGNPDKKGKRDLSDMS